MQTEKNSRATNWIDALPVLPQTDQVKFVMGLVESDLVTVRPDQINSDESNNTSLIWISRPYYLIITISPTCFTTEYFDGKKAQTCQGWLSHTLPEPIDFCLLTHLFRQLHQALGYVKIADTFIQPVAMPMSAIPTENAANASEFLDTTEKENVLDDFGLSLTLVDDLFDSTYFADDGSKEAWYYTGETDYENALDATIQNLQDRCYLTTPYNEIAQYLHIDWLTHDYLQEQIKTYGAQTAKAIETIYGIFHRIDGLLKIPLPMPSLIEINKNVMTYTIKWEDVKILVDLGGHILCQTGDELTQITPHAGVDKLAHQLIFKGRSMPQMSISC